MIYADWTKCKNFETKRKKNGTNRKNSGQNVKNFHFGRFFVILQVKTGL